MTYVAAPTRTPRTPAAAHQGRRRGRVPMTGRAFARQPGTATEKQP